MKLLKTLLVLFVLLVPLQVCAQTSRITTFNYDYAAALVQRLDTIYDQIPEDAYPVIDEHSDVLDWVNEVVPFFEYEGVVSSDPKISYYGTKYPRTINYVYYDTAQHHNHRLGTTDCMSGDVTLNARVLNPASAFYERRDLLVVIVHELAHVQGICWGGDEVDSEVSAHLATLEVLAAMVNRGNELVFGPLVNELRDMAIVTAWYLAEQEGRTADYEQLKLDVAQDAYELAYWDKADRYWSSTDPETYQEIVSRYNFNPLVLIFQALNAECHYLNIYWDTELEEIVREPITTDVPCINDVLLPINMDVFEIPLFIDDLSYFFEHAEQFV